MEIFISLRITSRCLVSWRAPRQTGCRGSPGAEQGGVAHTGGEEGLQVGVVVRPDTGQAMICPGVELKHVSMVMLY